jgi:hypothetical protein
MKAATKRVYNNCFLAALYLWLRGKLDRVAFVTTISWMVPYHFVGITKNGHAIHFSHNGNVENSIVPFWFIGQMVGIRRSKQQEELTRYNRRIYKVIPANIFIIFGIVFLWAVSPLWIICWMIYPLFFIFKEIVSVGR